MEIREERGLVLDSGFGAVERLPAEKDERQDGLMRGIGVPRVQLRVRGLNPSDVRVLPTGKGIRFGDKDRQRAEALVKSGVPRTEFMVKLKTDDLNWPFPKERIDPLYDELAAKR